MAAGSPPAQRSLTSLLGRAQPVLPGHQGAKARLQDAEAATRPLLPEPLPPTCEQAQ